MDFVAIDVETANADLASICAVGIVGFDTGRASSCWHSVIDPEDEFAPISTWIHGIDAARVKGAPKFSQVFDHLSSLLANQIVVSHTAFDRVSIARASAKYGIPIVDWQWLDTACVARRAWKQFSRSGYGLANLAEWCGISFEHHRADEDARAAGEVLLRAVSDTGISVSDWLGRVRQPIGSSIRKPSASITREGNAEGPLSGEVVAFTGALSIPRREAADLAATAGCNVVASPTKKTTLLVVGDQDVRKLAGHEKSSKHRKAEALIEKGQQLRILRESDFVRMVQID